MIRNDVIRYYAADPARRIADIPTTFDVNKRLSRVDHSELWRWRDPNAPLDEPSNSGLPLSDTERADLYHKLRILVAKQPRSFEPL